MLIKEEQNTPPDANTEFDLKYLGITDIGWYQGSHLLSDQYFVQAL